MAKLSVDDWSVTPDSNTDVEGIDIGPGSLAKYLNNAIQAVMSQLRKTPLREAAADMRTALDVPSVAEATTIATTAASDAVDGISGTIANISIDLPNNNTFVGEDVGSLHSVDTLAPLLTGQGTTAFGQGAMSGTSNNTYSVYMGSFAGGGANNNYCVNGYGIRAFWVLTDGQYMTGYGTDVGYSVTYGRNSSLFGAKAALHKTDIQTATVLGQSAAYNPGTLSNVTIIGHQAADGNSTGVTSYNISNALIVGLQAGRLLSGSLNCTVIGHNAWSLTAGTGGSNTVIGRSSASSLTSGPLNVFVGDSAGQNISTGNSNVAIGYATGGTSNFSNTISIGTSTKATASNMTKIGPDTITIAEIAGTIQNVTDNTRDVGTSALRYANVYGVNFKPGAGTVTWTSGAGTPEGAVTAAIGSLFTRTDGGASTTLYVKESGAGNTGWVAK